MFGPTFMSIAYVVLKLEREGQSDPPPVLPFSKKPSLGKCFLGPRINRVIPDDLKKRHVNRSTCIYFGDETELYDYKIKRVPPSPEMLVSIAK